MQTVHSNVELKRSERTDSYRLVSFFFSCSSTMASCSELLKHSRETEAAALTGVRSDESNAVLGAVWDASDPDVVDNSSSFALRSLRVSYQVVPGTENPPAEGEVLIGGAGQAEARVLRHPAGG